jgi:ATP-binding cassette subfamily B protein
VLAKWLLTQLSPMRLSIAFLVTTTLATLALNMAGPYVSKLIVDEGIIGKDVEALWRYSLILVALAVAGFALGFLRNFLTGRINNWFLYDMRGKVFSIERYMGVGEQSYAH